MSFQLLTKCCERRGRPDVSRLTVPKSRAGSSTRPIADSNTSWQADVEKTGSHQPPSVVKWQHTVGTGSQTCALWLQVRLRNHSHNHTARYKTYRFNRRVSWSHYIPKTTPRNRAD